MAMKTTMKLGAILLGFIVSPSPFSAAQTNVPGGAAVPLPQGTALSEASGAALRKAASSNLFEIESSRLALGRSQSRPVKEVAQRMVDDHTRAANRTRQVMAEMGLAMPAVALEPDHQQMLDGLKTAANQSFDRAYLDAQYTAHVEAIALLRQYASTGDNERLKSLAAQMLPILQSHLDHVAGLR